METLFGISQSGIGVLVWLLWALIGAFEALLAARMSQKRNLVADLVTGVIARRARRVISRFISRATVRYSAFSSR